MTHALIRELAGVAIRDAQDALSRGESERGLELYEHHHALLEAYYDAEIPTDSEVQEAA